MRHLAGAQAGAHDREPVRSDRRAIVDVKLSPVSAPFLRSNRRKV